MKTGAKQETIRMKINEREKDRQSTPRWTVSLWWVNSALQQNVVSN